MHRFQKRPEPSSVDSVGEHFDLSGEHVNLEEGRVKLAKLYHKARQDIDCARHSRKTKYHESDMEEARLAVLECAEQYEMIAKITNNRPAQNIKLLWEKAIKNLHLMLSAIEDDKKFTSLLLEIEGDKISRPSS
ncbi:hypothetical protein [Parasitella parasitica]|uniref:Uncharacterized protein n=1 Tax=Parasitella parasitica TaxID=35722 RepID=A0A0B7NBY5_9FUNG|nr:hypothetical protein [Parasitella parasitica]